MKKYDVKLLKYEDEQYPECLRNIHTPPTKLYCMGNINLLNKKRKIIFKEKIKKVRKKIDIIMFDVYNFM